MNFNDEELALIYLAVNKLRIKSKNQIVELARENILEKIDKYFTPGGILESIVYKYEYDK